MKLATGIMVVVALLATTSARACDFQLPALATFDGLEKGHAELPRKPDVRIEYILRGGERDLETSCGDTGVISIAIASDERYGAVAYSFEIVRGRSEELRIQSPPLVGVFDAERNRYPFVFPWVDGASTKQGSMDFILRNTPYNRYGQSGSSTNVRIRSSGS